jgi:hypothetical protein
MSAPVEMFQGQPGSTFAVRIPVCLAGTPADLRTRQFTMRIFLEGPGGPFHYVYARSSGGSLIGETFAPVNQTVTIDGRIADIPANAAVTEIVVEVTMTPVDGQNLWGGQIWYDDIRIVE